MAAGTSILLAICATLTTVGCASGHGLAPNVVESSTGRQLTGVIPGSWDRVAVLRLGSRVVVTLIDGERREGVFRALSPGGLGLTDSAGQDFDVARSNIQRIVARGE